VNYSPGGKKTFSPEDIENIVKQVCRKCDGFESQLPENIKCEATFKNLKEQVYRTGQSDFKLEPEKPEDKKLEELEVAYRFYVAYYI
jgi:hypothetical protein